MSYLQISRTAASLYLAVCLGMLLVFVGCGGSSSGSGESTASQPGTSPGQSGSSAVTRTSFIAAGDKICANVAEEATKLNAERTKLAKELASSPSAGAAKQMQDVLNQTTAAKEKTTKQLEDLEQPPSGGGADDYFAAREETARKMQASADAFGDYAKQLSDASVAAVTAAQTAEVAADKRETKLAHESGFEACGAVQQTG